MTTTVFTCGPLLSIQEINVKTKCGIHFSIDIISNNNNAFESTVTINDPTSGSNTAWIHKTQPNTSSAIDNFISAMKLISQYMLVNSKTDDIIKIHNPCNTPYVSEHEQNNELINLGINIKVQVN